tara:strand:- start:1154 stop:1462 length:309 start_codon:yes stop_codon:yes gene_type:complete
MIEIYFIRETPPPPRVRGSRFSHKKSYECSNFTTKENKMFTNHEREVEKFMGKAYTKLESYEDIGTVEINKELKISDMGLRQIGPGCFVKLGSANLKGSDDV